MVVSLCWKEGSSKAGLTGLKEVANGYRKGARVGYAKLSPGTDLYICPRSDAIITILAKYGFFKGMAAIDENRDSMIGCVVWRKNHTFSNSVGKKLDSKNSLSSGEPPNSPTRISVQQGEEKKSSTTKLAQESCQPVGPLAVSSSKLENPGENGTERMNSKTNEDQKFDKSSSDSISLPVASVPSNTLSIPTEQVIPADLYSPIHAPISPQTCNLMKQTSHGEDDDLPEFDFGAACGISATPMSQPLNPATDNKVVSLPVISQGSNSMNVGQLPAPPNRRIPFPEPHVRGFAISEEKAGVLVNPNKVPSDESLKKARLFDDDDMPEWCPPELLNPSMPVASNPLTKNSSKLSLLNLPPPPPIPPPSPADNHSAFSYRPFCPAFTSPTSVSVRPPTLPPPPHSLPFQSGPHPVPRPHFSSSNVSSVPFPFPNGRGQGSQ